MPCKHISWTTLWNVINSAVVPRGVISETSAEVHLFNYEIAVFKVLLESCCCICIVLVLCWLAALLDMKY